ncbi:MAG: site-specific integrase [Chloroflexota bacterium]|nr:site-specific integrase [Chloroflexota bacterium]
MPRPPASIRKNRLKDVNSNNASEENQAQVVDPLLENPESQVVATSNPPTPRRRKPKVAALQALQPPLFSLSNKGDLVHANLEVPALTSSSNLEVARWWFRSYMEQANRPKNTVDSYLYDLLGFEESSGSKNLDQINREDIATYLSQSKKKSTRKRRLTSLGALFKYLIQVEKVLDRDPTDNFYADFVQLKTPIVLDPAEQTLLLETANQENVRTYLMVYFMLRLGFTRTELLAIQPEHVNITDHQNPKVYTYYDDQRWVKKQRELKAEAAFTPAYQRYLVEFEPGQKLFEMLPQSVNKLVERVAREAGINKKVTPQSLRDTFGVEEAKAGGNSNHLLHILGLAPDPRNKMSVDRYVKLALRSGSPMEIEADEPSLQTPEPN